ncbi:MAG: hypothetical protein WD939_03665 [Dehalococcoidia bacterium]
MSDNPAFVQQATAVLREVGEASGVWYERWLAMSQSGYSDTSEALLDTDRLLATLEHAQERWRAFEAPEGMLELQVEGAGALENLVERLRELVDSLDGGDFERLRIASQAVELSVQDLDEVHSNLRRRT